MSLSTLMVFFDSPGVGSTIGIRPFSAAIWAAMRLSFMNVVVGGLGLGRAAAGTTCRSRRP